MVDTTLKGLIDRLRSEEIVAPHYNTIYNNLKGDNPIYEYDGYLFQKLTAGRNDAFIASQAMETNPEKQ